MIAWHLLAAGLALHQVATGESRAVDAAEKAAQAAQQAAESAAKAAAAAERAADAAAKTAAAATTSAKAAPPPPPPPTAPAAGDTTPWSGTTGLSLIWLTGNSDTLTFNATGSADKKWNGWGLGVKGYATYGQSSIAQGTSATVTAMAAGLKVRGDRDLAHDISVFLATGAETNHVKSVEAIGFGEAGAGMAWLDEKEDKLQKVLLRTDLSIHYERESDFQYYPTHLGLPARDLLGPRISGVFKYALRKDVQFSQDAEVIPNVLGQQRVRVNALSKISSRLTEALAMTLSFQLNYDSVPPPGKVPTDTGLMAGVELAL